MATPFSRIGISIVSLAFTLLAGCNRESGAVGAESLEAGSEPVPRTAPLNAHDGSHDAGERPPIENLASFRFANVQARAGLGGYVGSSGERGELHAPGGVFTDLNHDGFPDLVLVTRAGEPSYLFENTLDRSDASGKRRRFEPRSLGRELPGSTGAIAADVDNDGDLDVYVTNIGDNIFYENLWSATGELRFENTTASTDPTPDVDDDQRGLGSPRYDGKVLDHSLTAAFADFDRDGWIDLYVGSHLLVPDDPSERPTFRRGERDTLFRNNGDGTFSDVTMSYGVPGWQTPDGFYEDEEQIFSSTNAVTFADLNDDLWPDLFVTNKNDTSRDVDLLYVSRGADEDGVFLGFDALTYELSPPFGYLAELAMGVMAKDHDNDGDLDLYITDIAGNPMWVNQFAETGELDFEFAEGFDCQWSWGTQWQDFTNDGWLDLQASSSLEYQDCLYIDTAHGSRNRAGELAVDQRRDSRGVMSADYNQDGWLDYLVVNLDGPPSLFENRGVDSGVDAHYLVLSLVGKPRSGSGFSSTCDAIGTRVTVIADLAGRGTEQRLRRDVTSGDSNAASTSTLDLHFGTGRAERVGVEIVWPSGERQLLADVATDRRLKVEEP